MVRVDVRETNDRSVFEKEDPLSVRKKTIESCPSTGKTASTVTPGERRAQKP